MGIVQSRFIFPRRILAICRFLRLMWLLSTRPLASLFSLVLTFCLCVCIKLLYSIVAMCTGHYPVPSGTVDMTGIEPCTGHYPVPSGTVDMTGIEPCTGHYPVPSGTVDMTGIEPCKEVESVSECTVNGRMHAVWIKAHNDEKQNKTDKQTTTKTKNNIYIK